MDIPMLDPLHARLRYLQNRGGIPVLSGEISDWYEVMLFPPATEAQIAKTQAVLGKKLPDELLRFWRFSNGANLFINDSGLHGVGVASTELIRDLQNDEIEYYGREPMEPYVVFARVNGGGDFLVLDLETGKVLDGVHAEQPTEWRVIANNFREWLHAFLEASGRYYWLEALYRAAAEG